MVWLAKWIREHVTDARVLIITDRTELDEQIEKVFKGVNEDIYRTKSGADLIATLNATTPWLICSLDPQVRRQGRRRGGRRHRRLRRRAEEGAAEGLPAQGRPLRLRRRVPPHPVRRAARGDEGDPAGRDVHRLHRHAAAQGRQEEEHRDLRPLHPHLQVRRGGEGRRRARPALRGARHRPEHHLAGEDRPVVRGQDQGPDPVWPRRS